MDMLRAMWTPELAAKSVNIYRRVNSNNCDMWQTLDFILLTRHGQALADRRKLALVTFGEGYVALPNGMFMRYVPLQGRWHG